MLKLALNPIQWYATPDGWIDPSVAPPLEERLAVIAQSGFTTVQTELPGANGEAGYVARLAQYGIVPGPGYFAATWSPSASDQEARIEAARISAAAHARLGVDTVFISSGMSKDSARVREAAVGAQFDADKLAALTPFLGKVGEAMRSEGVKTALHPHVGTWVETEAETRFVLENTDPDALWFGPDIGHLAWAGANYLQLLKDYSARIPGIHVKDFRTGVVAEGRAQRLDYQATIQRGLWQEPGQGDCDFSAVFGALPQDQDRWVVIEVDYPTMTPAESVGRCGIWAKSLNA